MNMNSTSTVASPNWRTVRPLRGKSLYIRRKNKTESDIARLLGITSQIPVNQNPSSSAGAQ